ncbi:MAG: hypothetical protein MUF81_02025 [Verrucomicrobia bacterium]|jgi:hypothetical protein|nr:hypothetical protein [Verrucomicrobiota bacterium]
MDFFKRHYEKVLLGVVLAGLAVGAALLPWMISSERDSERVKADEIINRPIKALPPLDLSRATNLMARAAAPMFLDFSMDHKLFNPVLWQKKTDGTWKKIARGNEIGIEAMVFTKFTPLHTIITLDSVMMSDAGARYVIGVDQEAAPKPSQRGKKQTTAVLNEKKEIFTLRELKGPADNPAELVLELNDSGERASLSKGKPLKRVDGYLADLKYPPESRSWINQRVGARIRIASEDYIIVAIATNEVVFSAPSGKKTSRPYNPGS